MGNRNDYLPLEEASRMLGRPVSLLDVLGEEEVTAKLTGGRWVISERDIEKLRANLPEEPETVVHNFLADTPRGSRGMVQGQNPRARRAGLREQGRGKVRGPRIHRQRQPRRKVSRRTTRRNGTRRSNTRTTEGPTSAKLQGAGVCTGR